MNLFLTIVAYLNGPDLLHGIARLSKKVRAQLPESGLLDQTKVVTVNRRQKEMGSAELRYALSLVNQVRFSFGDYPGENTLAA